MKTRVIKSSKNATKKVLHKIRLARVVKPFHGKRVLQVRVNGKAGMVALRITIKLGKKSHTYKRFVPANHKIAVKNLPIPVQDREGDRVADRRLGRSATPGYAGEARYGGPPPPRAPDTTSAAAGRGRDRTLAARVARRGTRRMATRRRRSWIAIGGATARRLAGDARRRVVAEVWPIVIAHDFESSTCWSRQRCVMLVKPIIGGAIEYLAKRTRRVRNQEGQPRCSRSPSQPLNRSHLIAPRPR